MHVRRFGPGVGPGVGLGAAAIPLFLAACAGVSPAPERPAAERARTDAVAQNSPERSARIAEIVMSAMSLIGVPYRNGGENPVTGMDCSGFVRYVFRTAIGVDLPRRAVEIGQIGEKIPPSDLQPGDLVFYNTLGRAHSHVGIYIGGGRFVHAPSQSGRVRIEDMSLRYWAERLDGARRAS
jgi:cell wall-associated NlpC family hydrolase